MNFNYLFRNLNMTSEVAEELGKYFVKMAKKRETKIVEIMEMMLI